MVTTILRVQISTGRDQAIQYTTDQISLNLRGTDGTNTARSYEFVLSGNQYPFRISNDSAGLGYAADYPAWNPARGGTSPTTDCWLKMEYTESTHPLTNCFATAA